MKLGAEPVDERGACSRASPVADRPRRRPARIVYGEERERPPSAPSASWPTNVLIRSTPTQVCASPYLPHRELPAGQVWERRTATPPCWFSPFKGTDARMRGVPFGVKARLILLYLMTEAVKTRSRHVELGRSMRSWLASDGRADLRQELRTVATKRTGSSIAYSAFQLTNEGGQAAVRDGIIRGSFRAFPRRGAGVHRIRRRAVRGVLTRDRAPSRAAS